MLDLTSMKATVKDETEKSQVKTFLSDAARRRMRAAAEFVGVPQHAILERLIIDFLPDPEPPRPRRVIARSHAFPAEGDE
jgi:hypothetical protein